MPDSIALPDPLEMSTLAFEALLSACGPGFHHLVCTSFTPLGSDACVSVYVERAPGKEVIADADLEGALMFCHVLALSARTLGTGAVCVRSCVADRCVVRGWSVVDGWPQPLTAGQVFAAYCTDPDTGEPLPPEPGTDYEAGIPLLLPSTLR